MYYMCILISRRYKYSTLDVIKVYAQRCRYRPKSIKIPKSSDFIKNHIVSQHQNSGNFF